MQFMSQMQQLHASNGIANKVRARAEHLSVMLSPHAERLIKVISQLSEYVKQQAHLLHQSRSSWILSWKLLHTILPHSSGVGAPFSEPHAAPQHSKWGLASSLLQKLVSEGAFAAHQDEWEAVAAQVWNGWGETRIRSVRIKIQVWYGQINKICTLIKDHASRHSHLTRSPFSVDVM
jgi:hypothetical protein